MSDSAKKRRHGTATAAATANCDCDCERATKKHLSPFARRLRESPRTGRWPSSRRRDLSRAKERRMLSHPGVQPRDLEKEGEGKKKKEKKKKHFFSDDDFLDFLLSFDTAWWRACGRRRTASSTTIIVATHDTLSQHRTHIQPGNRRKREKRKKSKKFAFFFCFFPFLVSVFAEQCAHWLSRRSNNISLLRLLRAGAQKSHLNSKLNSQVRLLFVAPHRQQRCCVTRLTLFSFLVVYHSTSTNRMFGLRPHFHTWHLEV